MGIFKKNPKKNLQWKRGYAIISTVPRKLNFGWEFPGVASAAYLELDESRVTIKVRERSRGAWPCGQVHNAVTK